MLQFTRWVVYARAAAGNRTSVTYSPAPRGLIFDRTGVVVLAENRPIWSVSICPAKFPKGNDREKIILKLAGILKAPTPELRGKIQKALDKKGQDSAILEDFGEDVSFKTVAELEEQALPGVSIVESSVRSYPFGPRAAHVLGYARSINDRQYKQVQALNYPQLTNPDDLGQSGLLSSDPLYAPDSIFGQVGLEKRYEIKLDVAPPLPILSGRRGRTVYEVDAALNPVRLIEQRPPVVGASIMLTLDANTQKAAEEALGRALKGHPERTGAAVVVDVDDGGIVAMASLPGFNPNDLAKRIAPKQWQQLNNDPRTPLLNKATCGRYPPASTFKLISATAALETGRCTPNTRFYCSGSLREGPQTFGCWQHSGHGSLNMREAIAQSCDVYFYQLIRSAGLTPDDIAKYARMFGLGEETGLDLPEEITGQVPDPAWKQRRYNEPWWTGDSLITIIGQGAVIATPLQMALVCATVANGGDLLQPHLARKILWPQHLNLQPTVFGRVVRRHLDVRPETLKVVREGMRLAVNGPHGTAKMMADLPFAVAGKTGSAEHNNGKDTHAWFICFAPYDKPKYAIAVFVSEGGHGGATAAPVAHDILAALYGLKGKGVSAASVASD